MRSREEYKKVKQVLIDSVKDGKIKYSVFIRSSLNELQELTTTFHLSEIGEYLKIDTALEINYNSLLKTFNRFKNNRNAITVKPLNKSNSVPELGLKSEGKIDNYEWLDEINMNPKLKEYIISNNLSEEDFKKANPNINNPLTAIKTLTEYVNDKNLDKSSNAIFK